MLNTPIIKLILLTLTSLITLSVYADQTSCDNPMTTIQINECAAVKRDKAQQVMQDYLDQAIKQFQSDPVVQKSIRQAQAAWKNYAQAQCDSVYDIWRDGSIRGVMVIECQTDLINQRTRQIWSDYLGNRDNSPSLLPKSAPDH